MNTEQNNKNMFKFLSKVGIDENLLKLAQQVDLIPPKNHRYFNKKYHLEEQPYEITLILQDVDDYNLLLSSTYKKIRQMPSPRNYDHRLQNLFRSILQYFDEFTFRNIEIIKKLSKIIINPEKSRKKHKNVHSISELDICSVCQINIHQHKLSKLKQQLKVHDFEDIHNFYNAHNDNFRQLAKLKQRSKLIVDSEIMRFQSEYKTAEDCLSFQQFQQVLNLLSSDIYSNSLSIQKMLINISNIEKKVLETPIRQRLEEEQQLNQEIRGNLMNDKLKNILHLFFFRYKKLNEHKKKDAQLQVNIKDSDIIKDLERQKKHLKTKLKSNQLQNYRIIRENEVILNRLKVQFESFQNESTRKIEKLNEQNIKLLQQNLQRQNMNEIHINQIELLTSKYIKLLTEIGRKKDKSHKQQRSLSIRNNITKLKPGSKNKFNRAISKSSIVSQKTNQVDNDVIYQTNKTISSQKSILQNKNKNKNKVSLMLKEMQKRNTGKSEILKTIKKLQNTQVQQKKETIESGQNNLKSKRNSKFKALASFLSSNQVTGKFINCEEVENNINSSLNFQKNQQNVALFDLKVGFLPSIIQLLKILYKIEFNKEKATNSQFQIFVEQYNSFISKVGNQKETSNLKRALSLNDKGKKRRLASIQFGSKIVQESSEEKIQQRLTTNTPFLKQPRQTVKSKKKVERLLPLQKKSQYYFKKSKKTFNGNSLNTTIIQDNTLRSDYIQNQTTKASFSPKDQRILFQDILTNVELVELYQNNITANKNEYKEQFEMLSSQENKYLMKTMSCLAYLHLRDIKKYNQAINILIYPQQLLNSLEVKEKKINNTHQLRTNLISILNRHQTCHRSKEVCQHMTNFFEKLYNLCNLNDSQRIWNHADAKFDLNQKNC